MTNLVLIRSRGHFEVECWHLNIGAETMRIKKLKSCQKFGGLY